MMNSGGGNNYNSDDDDTFGRNPFRDDLFSSSTQQQNTAVNPMMMNQPINQPDPHSGMMGALELQSSPLSMYPPQHRQQQARLSGTMDQSQAQIPSTPPSWPMRIVAFFKLDSYTRFFDIDTIDVQTRLKAAAMNFTEPDYFRVSVLHDDSQDNDNVSQPPVLINPNTVGNSPAAPFKGPDLYGPFWISATLIFALAVTSNIAAYFHHKQNVKKQQSASAEVFEYDITLLLHAAYIVYGFVYTVPTIFYATATCLGMTTTTWALWICCYGYSQVPILAATLIVWLMPWWSGWAWLVLAVACAASGMLVIRNLSTPLMAASDTSKVAPLLLAIMVTHFIYWLVLKISFY